MAAWKRLQDVLAAFRALYWLELLIFLGIQTTVLKLIGGPAELVGTWISVFVTTAPLTLAFAAITFVFVEASKVEADSRNVLGGAFAILFVALTIGVAFGYPVVELPQWYWGPLTSINPFDRLFTLVFWLFLAAVFPFIFLGSVVLAYTVKVFIDSIIFGALLGAGLLHIFGRLTSAR
jgi:hypothetical protein